MRKASIWCAALCIVSLAAFSTARADTSVFGSLNFPGGDLDKAADTGWGVGGYSTASLLPLVSVGGLVAYNSFGLSVLDQPSGPSDDTLDFWEFHALGEVNVVMAKGSSGSVSPTTTPSTSVKPALPGNSVSRPPS